MILLVEVMNEDMNLFSISVISVNIFLMVGIVLIDFQFSVLLAIVLVK